MNRAVYGIVFALACAPTAAFAQDTEATGDDEVVEGEAIEESDAEPSEESDALPTVEEVEVPPEEPGGEEPIADAPTPEPASGGGADDPDLRAQLRQREEIRPWHVVFGTATGLTMYTTTILGFLTFSDRYGFDGPEASSGCGSGSPIFGAESCNNPPWGHLIAASTATTLFAITFTLALFMPDPLHIADGGGELATMLTVHRALRWVLLGLFVAQTALGVVASNVELGSFGAQRDLAVAHLVLGTVTMATMTTQGVLGSLMEW